MLKRKQILFFYRSVLLLSNDRQCVVFIDKTNSFHVN